MLMTGFITIMPRHKDMLDLRDASEPARAEDPSKNINRPRNEAGDAEEICHIRQSYGDTLLIPAELRHRVKKEAVGQ
jgi:hypothetical protein